MLYDYLVNPRILEAVRAARVRLPRPARPRQRSGRRPRSTQRLIAEARAGKTVVRLKGGDPASSPAPPRRSDALAAAGIAYEVVPGITAALAAGSYAGIPLTHRDTGLGRGLRHRQQKDDDEAVATPLDYHGPGRFPGTLVFYMGVTTARALDRGS